MFKNYSTKYNYGTLNSSKHFVYILMAEIFVVVVNACNKMVVIIAVLR